VKGKHKKFEPNLYDRYDGPAKEAMKVHLTIAGHEVTVPPENYGADLYSEFGRRRIYHEVEVSLGWEKGEHPYPRGSIPERKIRLCHIHQGTDLFFWMLRRDLKRALVFPSTCLVDEHLIEVPNRKIREGEFFYRIPKELGKEFNLYDLP
jgi:hypothetical protein